MDYKDWKERLKELKGSGMFISYNHLKEWGYFWHGWKE